MNEYDAFITKDEAKAVCEIIDLSLYDMIRHDPEIDSMQWLRNVIHGYEKLCNYSGYIGYTEDARKEGA